MYERTAPSSLPTVDTRVAPRPKLLPHKALPSPCPDPRNVDRSFPLHKPHHLRRRILRRYRDQHVDVIGHQMPLVDFAFPLPGQVFKYHPQLPANLPIQYFFATLRI